MKKSQVDKLLDDVCRILKRKGKSIADLARELGMSKEAGDTGYSQLYHWLEVRVYKPKGEAVLSLLKWRNEKCGEIKNERTKQ